MKIDWPDYGDCWLLFGLPLSFLSQVLECWEFSKGLFLLPFSFPLEDPSLMLSRSEESVSQVASQVWSYLSELFLFSILAV